MRFAYLWAVGLLALIIPAGADGISGTYVGAGSNSAFLLQVVEATGGQLTGRYEQTVLSDGKLNSMNASISGASDGRTVVLTIKPTELFSGSIIASGTLENSQLRLSGSGVGRTISLNLGKSNEADYRRKIAILEIQARAFIAARAEAEQLAHVNDLTSKLALASVGANAQLSKFPPIEQRYRAISELMRSALARQRAIYGGGQAAVARSQVAVAINQACVEAEQLHINLQGANKEIGAQVEPLIKDAVVVKQQCQADASNRNSELQSACAKFMDAAQRFKTSVEALGRAFEQAEQVWAMEHEQQQSIVRAADVASR
jgi:hypothetical protein